MFRPQGTSTWIVNTQITDKKLSSFQQSIDLSFIFIQTSLIHCAIRLVSIFSTKPMCCGYVKGLSDRGGITGGRCIVVLKSCVVRELECRLCSVRDRFFLVYVRSCSTLGSVVFVYPPQAEVVFSSFIFHAA